MVFQIRICRYGAGWQCRIKKTGATRQVFGKNWPIYTLFVGKRRIIKKH